MPHTVDKEGRRAIHAAAYAAHKIAAYLILELARFQNILQGCFGKAEPCTDQERLSRCSAGSGFKEGIVHIPKQSRRAGELSAFSGDLGVRAYFDQREMTENEPHATAK
jgi:hypothetical protein